MQYVGSACVEGTTITIPTGHDIGDVIWIWAFRDGSTTNPSVPAGWTTITNTFDGTTCSVSIGWKIAASSAETSGTWSNASALAVYVGRSMHKANPFGTSTNTAGTTSPSTYGARAVNSRSSWLIAVQAHRSIDTTTLTTPPSGMVLRASNLGAVCDIAIFDTDGPYRVGDYPANTVAPGGTASGWQTSVIEARDAGTQVGNWMSHSHSFGAIR